MPTDNNADNDLQQNEQQQPQNPQGSSGQGSIDDLPDWAQKLVKDLRSEAAANRVAKREAEEAARQREQARLAEEGKWKELAEQRAQALNEIEPYKERATTLEALIRDSNARRLEQVREDMRGLIPTDYAPEKLSSWLEANWQNLISRPAPSTDAGAGAVGSGNAVRLTEEQKRQAKLYGMTEEQYIAALKKSQT